MRRWVRRESVGAAARHNRIARRLESHGVTEKGLGGGDRRRLFASQLVFIDESIQQGQELARRKEAASKAAAP